eukprot:TRINITY_DN67213_c8_g4_i1.p1 TRINITY_DN67213_c8_g4~~TRINITY_DN67213_c8_g4_i1.p1  ORF type:complete len:1176 (+),score=311.84 TRINITY_DN67213_c8_g4_i1:512-3529(+)
MKTQTQAVVTGRTGCLPVDVINGVVKSVHYEDTRGKKVQPPSGDVPGGYSAERTCVQQAPVVERTCDPNSFLWILNGNQGFPECPRSGLQTPPPAPAGMGPGTPGTMSPTGPAMAPTGPTAAPTGPAMAPTAPAMAPTTPTAPPTAPTVPPTMAPTTPPTAPPTGPQPTTPPTAPPPTAPPPTGTPAPQQAPTAPVPKECTNVPTPTNGNGIQCTGAKCELTCKAGYLPEPASYACVDGKVQGTPTCVDECQKANPCKNGGQCSQSITAVTGWVCTCAKDWMGPKCETKITPNNKCVINSNPFVCHNGGACDTKDGTCSCADDWEVESTTKKCLTYKPKCPLRCKNGKKCNAATGACDCGSDYTGKYCQYKTGGKCADLKEKACMNGGRCVDKGTDYECVCPAGTKGKTCAERVGFVGKKNIAGEASKCKTLMTEVLKDCSEFMKDGAFEADLSDEKVTKMCAGTGCIAKIAARRDDIMAECGDEAAPILRWTFQCLPKTKGGKMGECYKQFVDYSSKDWMPLKETPVEIKDSDLTDLCSPCMTTMINAHHALISNLKADDDNKKASEMIKVQEFLCTKGTTKKGSTDKGFCFPEFYNTVLSPSALYRVSEFTAYADPSAQFLKAVCESRCFPKMISRMNKLVTEKSAFLPRLFGLWGSEASAPTPGFFEKWTTELPQLCIKEKSDATEFCLTKASREYDFTGEGVLKCGNTNCCGASLSDLVVDRNPKAATAATQGCATTHCTTTPTKREVKLEVPLSEMPGTSKRGEIEKALKEDYSIAYGIPPAMIESLKLEEPEVKKASKYSPQMFDNLLAVLGIAAPSGDMADQIVDDMKTSAAPLTSASAANGAPITGVFSDLAAAVNPTTPTPAPASPAIPTNPTPPTPAPASGGGGTPTPAPAPESGSNMGMIIGIIVGGIAALGLIVGGIVFVMRRNKQNMAHKALDSPGNPFDEQWGAMEDGEAYDSYAGSYGGDYYGEGDYTGGGDAGYDYGSQGGGYDNNNYY